MASNIEAFVEETCASIVSIARSKATESQNAVASLSNLYAEKCAEVQKLQDIMKVKDEFIEEKSKSLAMLAAVQKKSKEQNNHHHPCVIA